MAALLLLIRLRAKAMLRKWGRGLRTAKGLFLALFTLGFLGLIIGPNILVNMTEQKPPRVALFEFGPFFMLGLLLFNLLTSAGERAIYFSPSEVDFLFTAPFSRRQLLIYKLFGIVTAALALSFFLTIAMAHQFPNLVFGSAGMFLTMLFISLAGMFITLVGQTLSERFFSNTRKLFGLLILVVAGIALAQAAQRVTSAANFTEWARAISASTFGALLLAPLNLFLQTMQSETLIEFIKYGMGALLINVTMVVAILILDINYLESASKISQKLFTKVQRMQQSGGWTVSATKRSKGLRLSMLPYWWGVGPLAWRQLLTAIRTGRTMLLIAGILIACISVPVVLDHVSIDTRKLIGIVFAGLAYITLIFSLNLPMGFRSEIDHIQFFKALPVGSLAVTIGQLVGPVFVVTLFQWAVVAFVSCSTGQYSILWFVGASFILPLNVIVFGIANCLFLLYPVRMEVGSKDLQVVGLMVLFMSLQAISLVLIFGVIGGVAALTYFLTGSSVTTYFVSLLTFLLFGLASLLGTARAFSRFDVGEKLE